MANKSTVTNSETLPDVAPAGPSPVGKKTGDVVTVACKVPSGLHLRIFKMVEGREMVMGGGSRTIKVAEQIGDPVIINGPSKRIDGPHRNNALIVGGFALTPNVDKDFFDKWLADNKDQDYVKNGLVFAHEKTELVDGRAKEQRLIRSNMGPLDTESKRDGKYVDPRMPAKIKKLEQGELADAS